MRHAVRVSGTTTSLNTRRAAARVTPSAGLRTASLPCTTRKNERVFVSVIVVTDRVVLDQQLQDTIYQFEHKHGVVQKIDERSRQLAEALEQAVPIIITTLQKFPFVSQHLLKMAEEKRRFGIRYASFTAVCGHRRRSAQFAGRGDFDASQRGPGRRRPAGRSAKACRGGRETRISKNYSAAWPSAESRQI